MDLLLIAMALGATLLTAQFAALVLFREPAVAAHVTMPVIITVAALAAGLAIGHRETHPFDRPPSAQWLQAVVALVGTVLLTGLCLFFLKPRRSRVTLMRALTIGLASIAALLGAVRLWAAIVV